MRLDQIQQISMRVGNASHASPDPGSNFQFHGFIRSHRIFAAGGRPGVLVRLLFGGILAEIRLFLNKVREIHVSYGAPHYLDGFGSPGESSGENPS